MPRATLGDDVSGVHVAERGAARYYYVEQDHCVGSTPLSSLRTSYANIRKLTAATT